MDSPTEHAPTSRQLRLLDLTRQKLATRWVVSPLKRQDHYRHHEDEELGIPPLGSSAWFDVQVPPFTVIVTTPLPWEGGAADAVAASFAIYDAGRTGTAWALVEDGDTRRALTAAGFAPQHRATWSLRDHSDDEIVSDIETRLVRLAAAPLRILRQQDLPSGTPWPWQGLIEVLAADAILAVEDLPHGKKRVTHETCGQRSHTIVSLDDMALLTWWRSRSSPGSAT
jgi:hypothetical protein